MQPPTIAAMPLQVAPGKPNSAAVAGKRYDRAAAVAYADKYWKSHCSDGYVGVQHERKSFREVEPLLDFREPSERVFPRMAPSLLDKEPNSWFFVRSPVDAFVALGQSDGGDASLSILRFDGMAWTTSGVIPGERFLSAFAAGPDGALWALLSCGIRLESSEIWRLGPGPNARWERIAADTIGLESGLTAKSIMSAGEHDLLFAGSLKDRGWGLYRLRIDTERH